MGILVLRCDKSHLLTTCMVLEDRNKVQVRKPTNV